MVSFFSLHRHRRANRMTSGNSFLLAFDLGGESENDPEFVQRVKNSRNVYHVVLNPSQVQVDGKPQKNEVQTEEEYRHLEPDVAEAEIFLKKRQESNVSTTQIGPLVHSNYLFGPDKKQDCKKQIKYEG